MAEVRSAQIATTERQARAGARVLRGLMVHPHPMVARAIRESLSDLTWNDLILFTECCEAAVLANEVRPAGVGGR